MADSTGQQLALLAGGAAVTGAIFCGAGLCDAGAEVCGLAAVRELADAADTTDPGGSPRVGWLFLSRSAWYVFRLGRWSVFWPVR